MPEITAIDISEDSPPEKKKARRGSSTGVTKAESSSGGDDGDHPCTICFELFNDVTHQAAALKCGHIFGKECIKKWLKQRKECPQCKHKAKNADLIPLYNLPKVTVADAAVLRESEERAAQAEKVAERAQVEVESLKRALAEEKRKAQQQQQAAAQPNPPQPYAGSCSSQQPASWQQQQQQPPWSSQQQQHTGTHSYGIAGAVDATPHAGPSYHVCTDAGITTGHARGSTALVGSYQAGPMSAYQAPPQPMPANEQGWRSTAQAAPHMPYRPPPQGVQAGQQAAANHQATASQMPRLYLETPAAHAALVERAWQLPRCMESGAATSPVGMAPGSSRLTAGSAPLHGPFSLLQQYELNDASCFTLHAPTACLLVPEAARHSHALHVRKVCLYQPELQQSVNLPVSVSAVRDIQLQPDQAPSSSSPTAALATHGSGVLIISTQCDSVVASFNILEPACSLAWHPGAGRSYSLFAGLQTGMIAELDFRRLGAPVRMLQLANRVPLHSITILPPMQLGHAISPVAASIGYGEPLAMPMGLVASAGGAYAFWEDGTLVPLALNQPPPAAAGQLRGGQGLHDCCDCMSVAFSSSSPQVVAEWDSHIYRHGQVQGAGPYGGYPSAPAAGSAQAGAQASSQGRQAVAVDCGLDIVLSWRGQGAASGNASSTHRGQTTGTSPCHRAGPLMIHAWAVGHADVTPCRGAAAGRALSGAAYGLSRGGASQQHTVSMRAGHAPAAAFMPMMALHGHAGMSTGCRGCILPASMSMVSHAVHPNLSQEGLLSGLFFCSGDEVSHMPLLWSLGSGSLVQALQPHSTPVGFCAAASGPAGSGVLLGCCSSKQLKLYSCA